MPFANEAEVLAAEGLSFRYASEPVLQDASIRLNRGDFAGIIGSNGAGKSTLLKLLFGEIPRREGAVRWFGQDVDVFRDWPRVGYLPQNVVQESNSFPATAMEIVLANLHSKIGLFRPAGKKHREEAMAALEKLGVGHLSRRMLGETSGGQLQRIMLARALAAKPEALVLDEPTAGVDRDASDSLFALLSQINRDENLTILMVTHDIERVSNHAGVTYFLEDGKLFHCDDDFHRSPPHKHG